ncbi:hypothetical protein B0H14DRAFT_3131246 [Mycena olivaceomarginata]|nr:hypothetical protein B0H14DRAFT_3131246 [Mycena olivaceomarginata]
MPLPRSTLLSFSNNLRVSCFPEMILDHCGQGGHGGHGHPHGTGGPGGAGLGPNVNINQAFQPSNIQASQIINHCPPLSRIFQGRRDILDKMHYVFTSDVGIQHIYVLYGLGGAGKTQITLKFINESSSHFSDTFFIDASTIATIDTGLKNIAVGKGSGDSLQDGLLWLASRVEEWLLVFDSTDGSHSPVSDMEEEDAVVLLLKSAAQAATTSTMLTATEIVKVLHYLPLAIVQAGSFISKSQDLDGYLTLYTKNQARLLSEMPAQTHDHYAWTYCSFLDHNGISEQIFSYASKYTFASGGPSEEDLQEPLEFRSQFLGPSGKWDSLQFSNMTNEVQAYSLISLDAEKKLFSIHPLVHTWSRTTVSNPEKYMSTTGSILGMALSKCPQHDIQLGSLAISPHMELAVQMDAQVALVFKEQYGLIFWEAGKYKRCEKLLEEVLEEQKQVLGDNDPNTLLAMGNLASTYLDLGEHQKANELEATVLEKRKQVLGDNHPDTLLAIGNLACTYSHLGEHQKAKELKATVLEKWKQVLGDNHPDTLLAMGNLASTYSDLGEYQKAKTDTLLAMGNLACPYSHLGEHQKAKELKASMLEKWKQVLGDNHPDTLVTMGNLAGTYLDLGEHQKAKELQATVLEKWKQVHCIQAPDRQRLPSFAAIGRAVPTLRDRLIWELSYELIDLGGTLILRPLVFGQWTQTAAQQPLMQLSTVSEALRALTARPVIAHQVDLGRPPAADHIALRSAALDRGAADTPSVA